MELQRYATARRYCGMCFSLLWLEQLIVWAIIVGAIFALIRLVLPLAANWLGGPGGVIVSAINIILWAVVAIIVVYFVFSLIACLLGMAGPPAILPHR